jgi:hypothetical protein
MVRSTFVSVLLKGTTSSAKAPSMSIAKQPAIMPTGMAISRSNSQCQLSHQRRTLESVSKLRQGLQSFRSMRRMEASFRNARALRLRFSQSLARRRQRLSHAMVRSTIQSLGKRTNPLA